jgi:hypothetical protein
MTLHELLCDGVIVFIQDLFYLISFLLRLLHVLLPLPALYISFLLVGQIIHHLYAYSSPYYRCTVNLVYFPPHLPIYKYVSHPSIYRIYLLRIGTVCTMNVP